MTFPLPAVRRIAACILCTGLCTKNPNPFPLGTEFGLSLSSADNRTRTCTVSQRHLKPSRLPIPPYPHYLDILAFTCFTVNMKPQTRKSILADNKISHEMKQPPKPGIQCCPGHPLSAIKSMAKESSGAHSLRKIRSSISSIYSFCKTRKPYPIPPRFPVRIP